MAKVSVPVTNDFCPQTLFLYGTRKEDGAPNFGLFCWFSYCWDGEMGIMACISGEKLTKERIHRNRVFSANLVTEELLALADYFGNTDGFDPGKMHVDVKIGKGQVLDVPILEASPVIFELEVERFIPLDDGEVMLCKVRNTLQDDRLVDTNLTTTEKLRTIAPVRTTCSTYFGWDGRLMGKWGEAKNGVSGAN